MQEWNNLDTDREKYEYKGFLINYMTKIFDRRIKDYMHCSKVITQNGEQKTITFDACADSFEETKQIICRKIDSFEES